MAKYAYHRTDSNAAELYDYARSLGLSVEVIGRPVDIIVGAFGRMVAVEVKRPKGKLRPSQVAFQHRWRGPFLVWRDKADVERTLAYCQLGVWVEIRNAR